ncbi:hypothetical protein MCUN1_000922 [Malassezia cuniculi]|uniref:mRNA stability protein n=1 Tax=Malassezia cuniculi TaxID=948313 RepID=A0AAF0EPS6_9BASI|nr:hypothetical protein MCUN1_000922 [Malassezia cuniculi]
MLPQQRNKIDTSSLSEEERRMFQMYGRLPDRKDLLANKLKERKYFDSGDYALSKAGRAPGQTVGTTIPNPDIVPHAVTGSSPTHPGVSSGLSPPSHAQASPISMPGGPRGHSHSGSFGSSPLASSFPTAHGLAPSGLHTEPTSSLSREQGAPDAA